MGIQVNTASTSLPQPQSNPASRRDSDFKIPGRKRTTHNSVNMAFTLKYQATLCRSLEFSTQTSTRTRTHARTRVSAQLTWLNETQLQRESDSVGTWEITAGATTASSMKLKPSDKTTRWLLFPSYSKIINWRDLSPRRHNTPSCPLSPLGSQKRDTHLSGRQQVGTDERGGGNRSNFWVHFQNWPLGRCSMIKHPSVPL